LELHMWYKHNPTCVEHILTTFV